MNLRRNENLAPWNRTGLGGAALCAAIGLNTVATAGQLSFSIDFQGPTIGMPDSVSGVPITEGDILITAPPFFPIPGPLPPPCTVAFGGPGAPGPDLGLPGWFPAVGHPPGIPGFIEIDALSYGADYDIAAPNPGPPLWTFSVDEFAWGGPGGPFPSVFTEGMVGAAEASSDIFADAMIGPGPFPPAPPGAVPNIAIFDGDGMGPFGGPGIGLIEPNIPFPPPSLPDMGDNLDAMDVDELIGPGFVPYPVYFSLDAAFVDPLEFPVANTGSAAAIGFAGGDVLMSVGPGAPPMLYAPAPLLGLDIAGPPGSDDLDALALLENGDGVYTPSLQPFDWVFGATDMLLFSVRRGSTIIGAPDSLWGVPIEEGDILCPPVMGGASPFPGIFIPAEMLGLATARTGMIGPTGFADDLDALDTAYDCNANRYPDWYDIASGFSLDLNGNGIPDECEPCPEDLNGDLVVDVLDLLMLLAAWGNPGGIEDINGDGIVDVVDLLQLLSAWGAC